MGIIQMPLEHWQAQGINHFVRKAVPVFYPPHDKEFFPSSWSEPPLKADTSSEPHILLKASFAIKKFMVKRPAQEMLFLCTVPQRELINRRATNFLHGQIVRGGGRMALNKRRGLD